MSPPKSRLALDISNHQGAISDIVARAWRDAGVKRVIVGIHPPKEAIARAQLDVLAKYRFELHAYQYIYNDSDTEAWTRQVLRIITDYPVKHLWIDVEDDSGSYTPAQIERLVQVAIDTASAVLPLGVYTRREYWVRRLGNADAFAHLPLWDCTAAGRFGWHFRPYGGWTKSAMEQYALDSTLAGVTVDRNIY